MPWRISRRTALSLTAAGLATALIWPDAPLPALAVGNKSADLKERLEKGLQARRPEEFEFLGRVVTMVEQQKLPRQLVEETFQWSRRKRPWPYPFFERAVKLRAAQIGVVVR